MDTDTFKKGQIVNIKINDEYRSQGVIICKANVLSKFDDDEFWLVSKNNTMNVYSYSELSIATDCDSFCVEIDRIERFDITKGEDSDNGACAVLTHSIGGCVYETRLSYERLIALANLLLDAAGAIDHSEEESKYDLGNPYEFLVTTYSDGFETIFNAENALIVPVNLLSDERKELLRDAEYSKLLAHGGKFKCISIRDMIEKLKQHDLLDGLVKDS